MKRHLPSLGRLTLWLAPLLLWQACTTHPASTTSIELIPTANFDTIIDGKAISLYTLTGGGVTMQVTNYGGRVVSLWTPDREGEMADIVLGRDNLSDYIEGRGERFLGATIGRYGNRIAEGRFSLEGEEYQLSTFNNGQCLHGGDIGFDHVVWQVDSLSENALHLSYLSADGEEGFPGNLSVQMSYTLTPDSAFRIDYSATTDQATPINLTHHSFFNLNGEGVGTINDHLLTIHASHYTPVDSVLIPTGEVASVEGTPFDFRTATPIGARLAVEDQQLAYGLGYDHNWVLDRTTPDKVELAATLYSPASGRTLEVWGSEPALQFYGGNFLDGSIIGKSGKPYLYRGAVVFETQHYPDSPNHPHFPSTTLHPEEEYTHTCLYRFGVR